MTKDEGKRICKKVVDYSVLPKKEHMKENAVPIHINIEEHRRKWAECVYGRWYERLLKLREQKDEKK